VQCTIETSESEPDKQSSPELISLPCELEWTSGSPSAQEKWGCVSLLLRLPVPADSIRMDERNQSA